MQTSRFASLTLLAAIAGCSNSNPGNDAGGSDAGSDVASNNVTQTGTIIDFDNKSGVFDVIVTATYSGGSATATTDDKGAYTLSVPKNTPYTMSLLAGADAGKAYIGLDEQEWSLAGNADRGKTSFVGAGTEGLLQTLLAPKPDPALAVLSIEVEALASCTAGATGATISVPGLPAADAGASDSGTGSGPVLVYFSGGLPSSSATSVQDGQLPSAIVYDMPLNAAFTAVTVTHPSCKQKAFPVPDMTDPNIVYTGNVKLVAGSDAVSFMRVFLE